MSNARTTDPITSHWAAADKRLRQRDMLLHAYFDLYQSGGSADFITAKTFKTFADGLTADEAFDYATSILKYPITANSYWKRISDLNAQGFITWNGEMRMSNSKHLERVFVITRLGVEMAAAMFGNNNKQGE